MVSSNIILLSLESRFVLNTVMLIILRRENTAHIIIIPIPDRRSE